jgi:predicted  nucleic acid-binding Zn ribbon protein
MHLSELKFTIEPEQNNDIILDAIEILLGALRLNGQIIGNQFPVGHFENIYYAYLMLPDEDSLLIKYSNEYVQNALNMLTENKVILNISIKGIEPYSAPLCMCNSPSSYVLYTN